jgi:undecaprenyl-phosphate 4-deoxy-4-formamido-L-arabinose transferase
MSIQALSVVIPVYNSEGSLAALAEQLLQFFRDRRVDGEVILVNDGSRDRSWQRIQELCQAHPEIRGVNLMRNYGQHNALLCGIRQARHAVTATMDDDLQHPPEELPRILERLEEGFDVVYGTPLAQQHGLFRDMASIISKFALQGAMGAETARRVSAFRVFRTSVRQAFAAYEGSFVSIDVLLTWATTRFSSVAVRHEPRTIGTSNYTFRKLVTHALNMMTGFSVWPLQAASIMGFVFTVFGLLVLIYVVGRYLIFGSSVAGFPFLASLIAIFSGAQMFALGIMGEYLARIHFRSMERPPYAIREQVDCGVTNEIIRPSIL